MLIKIRFAILINPPLPPPPPIGSRAKFYSRRLVGGIRLQNVETTRIQRRGVIIRARGGLYRGGLSSDVFFCLQIDGPITGRLKSEGGGGGRLLNGSLRFVHAGDPEANQLIMNALLISFTGTSRNKKDHTKCCS